MLVALGQMTKGELHLDLEGVPLQPLICDRQVSGDCFARWRRNAFEVAIADDAMRSQLFIHSETGQQIHDHGS